MTSIHIGLSRVIMSTAGKAYIFGVFLVCILSNLDWIRKDPEHLSVFSPNTGKYGPEKLRIRALFTQWDFSEKMQIGWRVCFNMMIYLSWVLAMKMYTRRYICKLLGMQTLWISLDVLINARTLKLNRSNKMSHW